MRVWSRQGLGGGKFSREKLKAILGASIQVAVERVGTYIDLVSPELQPASMTPAQVRELFHAVAQDRAGRGRLASLEKDQDIEDLQPGSWAQQLRRYRPLVDHLFEKPGRLKPL